MQNELIETQANDIKMLQQNMKRKDTQFKAMETDVIDKIRKVAALENFIIAPKCLIHLLWKMREMSYELLGKEIRLCTQVHFSV